MSGTVGGYGDFHFEICGGPKTNESSKEDWKL